MNDNEYSDYDEYIKFNNGTFPYISDNNINKMQRMIKSDIRNNNSTKIITTTTINKNTNYTVLTYTVGKNSLLIFYEGCKLIKDENYIEVGTEGQESTTIQFKDWDVPSGSNLEFIYK